MAVAQLLRLRVVLTEQELAATNPACLFSDKLHHTLSDWKASLS